MFVILKYKILGLFPRNRKTICSCILKTKR
nr:MAG TPA: hypothetical protein [Caudoviricetes sp.]